MSASHKSEMKRYWHLVCIVLAIFLFWRACIFTGVDPALFWSRKSHLLDIAQQMFPPDLAYLPKLIKPLAATLAMSVTGTVLGAFLALLITPWTAKGLEGPVLIRGLLRVLIQILRSFPSLILALLATFFFGMGSFAGAVAITVYTFAIMARLSYEDVETASFSAYHALRSMGVSRVKAYYGAIVPEILHAYLTNALYLLETNVRHSAILGYVGAGGLGMIINENVSWREYARCGTILLLLFLTVLLVEQISALLVAVVNGRRKLAPAAGYALKVIAAVTVMLCTIYVGLPDFSHTSMKLIGSMLRGLTHPDWAFFFGTGQDGLAYLLLETVCIAFVGTVMGMVIAIPLSFLGSSALSTKPLVVISRLLISAIRSVPFLIYGLIFIRVSGPGAFTGVLTMAVCSIGLLSKRCTQAIDSMDLGAYKALRSMGVSRLMCIRHAILPQIMPAFTSAILYRFDVNTREAAILGLVGAGGIGAPLIFAMNKYQWDTAGTIALGLIILVWIVDVVSGKLRKRS